MSPFASHIMLAPALKRCPRTITREGKARWTSSLTTCVKVPLKFMLPLTDQDIQGLKLSTTQNLNWRRLACHITTQTCKEFIVMKHRHTCDCHQNIAND